MPINVDFTALWKEVRKISEQSADFQITRDGGPAPTVTIEGEVKANVTVDKIDFSGLVASYDGMQILFYIPDHGSRIYDVIEGRHEGNKFHVTDCKAIDQMRASNRFDRYLATNIVNGDFDIYGYDRSRRTTQKGVVRLRVCKLCLAHLNYKGYKTEVRAKDAFVRNFSIKEFFETYSSCFRIMPKSFRTAEDGNYSADWPNISSRLRAEAKFCCQECKVDLSEAKSLLHVHHINGVKSDNQRSNLRVLCADCHRRQPLHSHIHISHADMQTINRLRRKSQVLPDDWDEALQYADKATFGALALLRKEGYPPPEIGYEIQDDRQAVIVEFEAAWPARKYALVLSEAQKLPLPGWTIHTITELHRART